MRPILSAVPFAAFAAAIVVPDTAPRVDDSSSVFAPIQDAVAAFKDGLGMFEDAVSSAGNTFTSAMEEVLAAGETLSNPFVDDMSTHKHKHADKTIYQLIKENEHTTKFAALIDEDGSLVDLLNSTDAGNHTLFVPIDAALRHHPGGHDDKDHDKPSPDDIKRILHYHVGVGLYPARRILTTHTIPTTLDESTLGSRPQRLRSRVSLLSGVSLNFYSRVVGANWFASNGVIHAVNKVLVPPPFVGRELSLFPAQFSTLLLAYEKTDFVKFIHNVDMSLGSTVFAPSNGAFEKLGPRANAFLFNTEKGLGYLKALLKYHIVANETLYSDAFYRGSANSEAEDEDQDGNTSLPWDGKEKSGGAKHSFVVLPSLLHEKSIAVDIWKWGGFTDLKINGYAHVVVQDGVAQNGVIHVVQSVLLPPKNPGSSLDGDADNFGGGEIEVEELIERLAPFVEEETDVPDEIEWAEL